MPRTAEDELSATSCAATRVAVQGRYGVKDRPERMHDQAAFAGFLVPQERTPLIHELFHRRPAWFDDRPRPTGARR
jgi:hypothetical protein